MCWWQKDKNDNPMTIQPFKLERYFARYEFSVKYLLSSSDCESLGMDELLGMASPESRAVWEGLKLGYTESQGQPLLREEAAKLYEHIPADNVLIAAPEEAIFVAMQTLLQPGEHVIAVSPTYQSLYEIARSLGCHVTPWPLQSTPASWALDIQQLEASITDKTRLLVLNFPNNPTGYLPTRQEFDDILSLARRHNLTIFSDEMYRLLESDPDLRLPSVADAYENGIALSGLSKSFALPGLRIGWLVSQRSDLVPHWLAFKDYTTICNSAPSEILGIIALQNTERIVQRNLDIIRENIAIAAAFFAQHSEKFTCHLPKAGSIAFPKWRGPGTVEQLAQGLLDREGVMIVPGHLFDVPGNHFRIGLGRKNFGEALERVDEFLKTVQP
jgi:aspartate/methionine/tyrosine aminotransferase